MGGPSRSGAAETDAASSREDAAGEPTTASPTTVRNLRGFRRGRGRRADHHGARGHAPREGMEGTIAGEARRELGRRAADIESAREGSAQPRDCRK